jgi:hypothetical protein
LEFRRRKELSLQKSLLLLSGTTPSFLSRQFALVPENAQLRFEEQFVALKLRGAKWMNSTHFTGARLLQGA